MSKLKFCNNKKAKLVIMKRCLKILKRLQSLRVILSKSLKSIKDQAIKRNIPERLSDRRNRMSGNQVKILKEKKGTKSSAIRIEKQSSKSRIDGYKSTITRSNRNWSYLTDKFRLLASHMSVRKEVRTIRLKIFQRNAYTA